MSVVSPSDQVLERLAILYPKTIDLSLDRIRRLLDQLGNPERRLPPVVHVAGTNGKGSTIAYLRAMAEATGLRVHVHTSPHLVRSVERIRLAGTLIEDEALLALLTRVEAVNAGEPITIFEVIIAATLLAFAETPADLVLLEVGLGGRYDATNVVDRPALCVIAPVDHDHHEYLGHDLAGIAGEKAGILKPGVPAVVARQQPEAMDAIEAIAFRVGAPLTVCGVDFDAWSEGGRLAVQVGERFLDLPPPALSGPHQIANAGLAVVAALKLGFDEAAIARGIQTATWPARMQRLTAGPLAEAARARGSDLWLDGAHNPHAARALAEALSALAARDGRPTTLIVGMLANKDAAGLLAAVAPLKPRIVTTGFAYPSAADPQVLAAAAQAAGLEAEARPDVTAALQAALAVPGPAPRVVICGSLYLAGEALGLSPETWPT